MKKKLYVIDFDNTLVNTAETIRNFGSQYNLVQLEPYYKMVDLVRRRLRRGNSVLVLSARHPRYKSYLQEFISELLGRDIEIILVRIHMLKWFYVNRWATQYHSVVVIDDMLRKEETGSPKKLFYPTLGMKNITYIAHDKVINLRNSKN